MVRKAAPGRCLRPPLPRRAGGGKILPVTSLRRIHKELVALLLVAGSIFLAVGTLMSDAALAIVDPRTAEH